MDARALRSLRKTVEEMWARHGGESVPNIVYNISIIYKFAKRPDSNLFCPTAELIRDYCWSGSIHLCYTGRNPS